MKLVLEKIVLILLIFASSQRSFAETSMNGISEDQFGDFKKNWNFVTVRFRRDTNEMRFVYANDIAWEALKKNTLDYPDGAVFAKLGIATADDTLFPSSAVPSGKRRIQFMVREKTKYKSTEGWGYALFDWTGKTFSGDANLVTQGCAGCHQIAKDRGYVFSQMIGDSFVKKIDFDAWKRSNKFVATKVETLPLAIRNHIPSSFRKVNIIYGSLSDTAFYGTLDEVGPILSKEAAELKLPALLLSKDEKQFSLVIPREKNCDNMEPSLLSIHTVPDKLQPTLQRTYCYKND